MTPQDQTAAAPQPSWFKRNWIWVVVLGGCLGSSMCCGVFGLLGVGASMLDEPVAARVDCGTPGPDGVDCDLERTAGTGALKSCWDLEITCANQGVMVGHACGKLASGATGSKVNMPVAGFSNQAACDAPKNGVVMRLTVEPDL